MFQLHRVQPTLLKDKGKQVINSILSFLTSGNEHTECSCLQERKATVLPRTATHKK